MIVHHAAKTELDIAKLRRRGSTGKGPAAMGLWTCVALAEWQRSYGPVLNRLTIDPTAQILPITSKRLCDLVGAPTSEAWADMGEQLMQRGWDAILLIDPITEEGCEMIILDPSIVMTGETVEWDTAIA